MKRNLLLVVTVLVLMVCIFIGLFFGMRQFVLCGSNTQQAQQTQQTQQENRTISVYGTSSVTVSPTIAYVNIGVVTFNSAAAVAQTENADKMKLVYEELDKLGIDSEKIKTISYSISEHYEYTNYSSQKTGYDVTNTIQVTVMDIEKVSQVLDVTAKQGVNQANSISFGISDEEKQKIYRKALSEAVESAKEKADTVAKATDITLDEPAQIIENTPVYDVWTRYDVSAVTKSEDSATPISGGELKIEANVTVIYNY